MRRINIKKITDELVAAEAKDWKERHAAWVAFDKTKKQTPEWIAYKRLKDKVLKDKSPSESERKERDAAKDEWCKVWEQMPEWIAFKKLRGEYYAKYGGLGKLIEN